MFIRDGCFQKKRYPELARAGSRLCQAEAQSTRADVSQKSIPQAIGLPPLTHHGCKSLGCFQSYCYGAVLAPDVIVGKKYYRLQFALEVAACSNLWLHLVKMQGNFCSPKEQIAKLKFTLAWPTGKRSWCWQVLIFWQADVLFRPGALFWGDVLCHPDLLLAFLIRPLQQYFSVCVYVCPHVMWGSLSLAIAKDLLFWEC